MQSHSEKDLVELDQDHPGFRDAAYRQRRNDIARLALEYQPGDPVPEAEYLPEEHEVWRTVWTSLEPLHDRYACREYLQSAKIVDLDRQRIPQLVEVNPTLQETTGYQMYPVAGLVTPKKFLSTLGEEIFLSTQYIRHHSKPLYTPEPDIVHELVGHAASLVHEGFTELSRVFGEVAPQVDEPTLTQLINLYWYTLEFGVVKEGTELKVYGAGLLSSFGELGRFEEETELRPLDIEEAAATDFDPTDYQKVLFVAPSFNEMVKSVGDWVRSQVK